MPDFSALAFATTHPDTVGHERTMADRLLDVFNVKDYGAIGDDIHDDTAAIQAAINNTFNTGIIFFPPGIYKITSPLRQPELVGGVGRHRMLIYRGCGADIATGKGSILHANMPEYIFYSPDYPSGAAHRNALSIEGLGFHNETTVIPTSTEPPSSLNTTGNGSGCINSQSNSYLSFLYCDFKVNNGICIYLYGQNARVANCTFKGNFGSGGGNTDSIGVCNIETTENCTFQNLGTGVIAAANNGLIVARDLDFYRCGICMEIGFFPIDWWDVNLHHITPAGNAPCKASYFCNIRMRSFASYGMYIWGLGFSVLDNLIIDSDGAIGVPLSGIMAPSGANVFRNGKITGTYSVAALDCNNAKSNCYYTYEVTCSGPGVVYRPLASTNSNDLPNFFINCSFDTGQNIANIPSTPGWKYRSLLCNDSTVPVWDSTLGVSNVGAPFLGSGTNKVLVAYNGFNWYVVG